MHGEVGVDSCKPADLLDLFRLEALPLARFGLGSRLRGDDGKIEIELGV